MFVFHDLLSDNIREIAHHLNPADHIMLAFTCRYTLSCLPPPRGLDALVTSMYHHGNLRQLTYFEKKWRTQYDDAIMISRWKGQMLRIVDDLSEWTRLPPYVGQLSLISTLHRYGLLLWCGRHRLWFKLREAIIARYPAIAGYIGWYCDTWYVEDLAVNFREHVRPEETQQWYDLFMHRDSETHRWRTKVIIADLKRHEKCDEPRPLCVIEKGYCSCLECVRYCSD